MVGHNGQRECQRNGGKKKKRKQKEKDEDVCIRKQDANIWLCRL